VTNRHVVTGLGGARLRFNPAGALPAKEYDVEFVQAGKPVWYAPSDPDVDVVVVPITYSQLIAEGVSVSFFASDGPVAVKAKMTAEGYSEGDHVFVLGFPFGDVGGTRSYVVARSGVIARIRDTLSGARRDFLLDVPTFPGNSGGPVVSEPGIMSIQGTRAHNAAVLVGITSSSVYYRDEAVSKQTGRTRIIFEENSGLSNVFPVDYIEEAVQLHLAGLPPPAPGTTAPGSPPGVDKAD
jgi:hypothetical protein